MGYAKLYSLADSSIMEQNITTRFIFLFLLSQANWYGYFDGSLESLARRANVPQGAMEEALDIFQAPDVRSKSRIEDGKRLIYQGANKWWIVNYVEYRTREDKSYQRLQWRKRTAKKEILAKGEEWDENEWYRQDAIRQGSSREVHGDSRHTDTDTVVLERDISSNNTVGVSDNNTSRRWKPPTERECGEWLTGRLLPEFAVAEAEGFISFYKSKNWMIGKTKMSDWKTALGRWAARAVSDGRAKYTKEERERRLRTRIAKIRQLEERENVSGP